MIANITTRDKGGVIVVDVSGRLTLSEGSSALREKIWELVETGFKRILINMADITSIDNSGLGELVAAYTTVSSAGGEMKLLSVGKRVKQLLQITKLCAVSKLMMMRPPLFGVFRRPRLWHDSNLPASHSWAESAHLIRSAFRLSLSDCTSERFGRRISEPMNVNHASSARTRLLRIRQASAVTSKVPRF